MAKSEDVRKPPFGEPFGMLDWHSSGPDEGPDVAVSIRLGDSMLWCGEITDERYEETPGAADLGDSGGWWIILYRPEGAIVIGKCCDGYEAKEAFEYLSGTILAATTRPNIGDSK